MLCRDADSCYWIGRYIERAEATARILDVHYHFGLESTELAQAAQWTSLLSICSQEEVFEQRYGQQTERNILQFFGFDSENPGSIRSCLRLCRENARSIREQISSEMWESLNRTFLGYREWDVDRVLGGSPHEFFQWVKDASHLFQGITNRTLMMGESRDFLDTGRFLERADQTARILDVKYHDLLPRFVETQESPIAATILPVDAPLPDPLGVGGPVDVHGWISVLKSVGAYEAFRKTYFQVTPTWVADFLVLNHKFPASILHSIARTEGCMRRVSGNLGSAPVNAPEREIGKLSSQLTYITAKEIIADGLHEFLEHVQVRCNDIGVAIAETYLKY